jgi:ubiquinone biosynthesis protein UbiJ
MMEEFLKLLAKKAKEQGGVRQDKHMEAKAAVAKELSDVLGGDLADDIKGLKKVTVASNSEEGLKKGLEKAEDIVGRKLGMEGDMEESEDEMEESEDERDSEEEESSEEESDDISEVEDEIAALEEQIRQLKSKKR